MPTDAFAAIVANGTTDQDAAPISAVEEHDLDANDRVTIVVGGGGRGGAGGVCSDGSESGLQGADGDNGYVTAIRVG